MITKEVNEWIKKVEAGAYTKDDALIALNDFAKYLTYQELLMIKRRLQHLI